MDIATGRKTVLDFCPTELFASVFFKDDGGVSGDAGHVTLGNWFKKIYVLLIHLDKFSLDLNKKGEETFRQ